MTIIPTPTELKRVVDAFTIRQNGRRRFFTDRPFAKTKGLIGVSSSVILSKSVNPMNASDNVFRRALEKLLKEIFEGPPGGEAYLLNPGDPGLLRQLDSIDARAASSRPMPGKTTVAAHVDHVLFGFKRAGPNYTGQAAVDSYYRANLEL